jgi:N-acetylmuramoyl-L-alanine amidase
MADSLTDLFGNTQSSGAHKPASTEPGIHLVYPKPTAPEEFQPKEHQTDESQTKENQTYETQSFILGHLTGLPQPESHPFWKKETAMPRLWLHYAEETANPNSPWAYRLEIPYSAKGFFARTLHLPEPGKYAFHLSLEPPDSSEDGPISPLATYNIEFERLPDGITPGYPVGMQADCLFPKQESWFVKEDDLARRFPVTVLAETGLSIEVFAHPTRNQKDLQPIRVGQLLPLSQTPGFTPEESKNPYWENRTGIFSERHQTQPRISKKNVYQGMISLTALSLDEPYQLRYQAHSPASNNAIENKSIETIASGTVTLLPKRVLATVLADDTVCRISPEDGHRLTALSEGCVLSVLAQVEDWSQVAISPSMEGWVKTEDLKCHFDIQHDEPRPQRIGIVKIHHAQNETHITIPMERRIPAQIRDEDLWGLVCHLPQSVSTCDFVHFTGEMLDGLEASLYPDGEEESVLVVSTPKAICGYEFEYVDTEEGLDWVWTLRHYPAQWSDWKILIDPGHGGEELGAIALDGTPEKDLNLRAAKQLNKVLRDAGVTATVTRHVDKDLTLSERLEKVRQLKPHVVLSLHHNALPQGRDPLSERGVSTYFYHPFAKPLAVQLQKRLPEATGLPSYGLLYDNLFMTRIHEATSLLLELAFIINPEDCEVIYGGSGFYQKQAEAILMALKEYYEWTESIYHHTY